MRKLLLLLLFIFSCVETPELIFEKDGVSITTPRGWEITEQENYDDLGYYLAIEKDGFFSSSGIMLVMWFENRLDRTELLSNYVDELSNQWMFSDISSSNITSTNFNKINTLSLEYIGTVFGIDHEGISHSFYHKGKTFFIAKQGAIEDRIENEIGFELIEKSFKVN